MVSLPNLDKPAAKVATVGCSRSATQAGTKQELVNCKSQITNPKQISNYNVQMTKTRLRRDQSSRLFGILCLFIGICLPFGICYLVLICQISCKTQ